MRKNVELAHASRLINHGPTVLVSSAHGGRGNVRAAAWSMPVEFEPPRIAVVIDKNTFTSELVLASGCFAVCIPGRALADLTYTVGSVSGRETAAKGNPQRIHWKDKLERFDIVSFDGPVLGLPLVEGCVAWMECRLLPEPRTQQAYDTCFAEVVSAQADPRVFDQGRWSFRQDNLELRSSSSRTALVATSFARLARAASRPRVRALCRCRSKRWPTVVRTRAPSCWATARCS